MRCEVRLLVANYEDSNLRRGQRQLVLVLPELHLTKLLARDGIRDFLIKCLFNNCGQAGSGLWTGLCFPQSKQLRYAPYSTHIMPLLMGQQSSLYSIIIITFRIMLWKMLSLATGGYSLFLLLQGYPSPPFKGDLISVRILCTHQANHPLPYRVL
jgi:hypothetical protein